MGNGERHPLEQIVANMQGNAVEDRKTAEYRLAATLKLARQEYQPVLRLAYASFADRVWWMLTGRLPKPKVIT